MNLLYRQLERYINQHKKSKVWRRTVFSLACLVVFMTTYALILPAITVDEETANEMSGIAVAEANEELVEVPEAEEEPGVVLIDTAQLEEPGEQPEEPMIAEESDAELSAEENPTDAEASVPENTAVEEIELVETEDTQTLFYQGKDYTVTVNYDANAQIPEDAVLSAEEILPETPEYESYYQQALDTEGLAEINFAHFFDIKIMSNSEKVEPAAPVQISIEYADSVSIPEGTKNAIHFKDSGDVELIDAETSQNTELLESNILEEPTTAVAEGNTFTFAQDSFSVTGTVVKAPAANKQATMSADPKAVTLTAGGEPATVTITCENCSVSNVTPKDKNVATASWNKDTKTITITCVSAGTTTITVTGKANKGYETPKELTINVTVKAAGTAGNSVDLAQRGTSALYSIKGKATAADGKQTNLNSKNKNRLYLTIDAIPEGTTDSDGGSYAEYQKKVETDTGTTEFDFLQFYHIGLVDKDGKAVTTSEDDGITYDIEVTFNSGSEIAAWLKENSSADLTLRHYKKESGGVQSKTINDSDSAKVTPVGNSGKYTVKFRMKSFSALGFSHSSGAPDRTSTSTFEYQANSIISKIGTVNTDNEWQIVGGEYINNIAGYKTPGDRVRVQKNVIPTGVENEFWMYLGIDINYESILSEQLQTAGLVVGSSDLKEKDIGKEDSDSHSKQDEEAYYGDKDTQARALVTEYQAGRPNKFQVNFHYNGKTYSVTRYCQNSSFGSGHVAMKIGAKWYLVAQADKGNTGVVNITLYEESVKVILSQVTNVSIGHVVDTMGTGITAISGSAQTKNGTVSISPDGKTITWDPVATTLGTTSSGWYENAGELIYKIELDPSVSNGLEKDGTKLATNLNANVATNGSAKLTYTITDNNGTVTTKTQPFTSPVVRGMLYEIKAHKYAKDTNESLPGAVFGLYSDSACTTKVAEATSSNEADKKGEIDFTGLPWGTYYIKEISAPDGYKKEDTASSAITVCYTTDKAKLTGQGAGEEALYNGSTISFENEKKALNVILRKTDQSGYVKDNTKYLEGAKFTITKEGDTSWQGTLNTSNGQGYLTSEDGIALEDGTYYLTETTPPTGYVAKNFKLTVNSATPSVTLSIKGENGEYTDIDKNKSVVFNDDNTTATVYVTNNPAATLPSTGGAGTLPYTLGGFALIAFSALMYGCRMRRKRERRSM